MDKLRLSHVYLTTLQKSAPSSISQVQWPSSPSLLLSLQQMDYEGLKPSTLPTVLAPTLIPNIHTNTQCSSLSVCPQCFQVTGWGAKNDTVPQSAILHLLYCHAEPPGSSRRVYLPVALSPAPLVSCRGGLQELALTWLWHWPLFVPYNLCLSVSVTVSGGNTPKVCLWVWVDAQADASARKHR